MLCRASRGHPDFANEEMWGKIYSRAIIWITPNGDTMALSGINTHGLDSLVLCWCHGLNGLWLLIFLEQDPKARLLSMWLSQLPNYFQSQWIHKLTDFPQLTLGYRSQPGHMAQPLGAFLDHEVSSTWSSSLSLSLIHISEPTRH